MVPLYHAHVVFLPNPIFQGDSKRLRFLSFVDPQLELELVELELHDVLELELLEEELLPEVPDDDPLVELHHQLVDDEELDELPPDVLLEERKFCGKVLKN